jgi:endonuclease I
MVSPKVHYEPIMLDPVPVDYMNAFDAQHTTILSGKLVLVKPCHEMLRAVKWAMYLARQSVTALLLVTCCAQGQPLGYYDAANGKTGAQLRQALHSIIRNHTVVPYSSTSFDTSDALKILDEDPANTNNVILLYAVRSQQKDSFAQTGGWNREHMWPNSYGLDDRHPAYSDLFNLRPEDENVNSARGNKFYDVSDTNSIGYRLPAHAEAPLCSTDADSWEPPDALKGDIARAMFYMDVRYEGSSGEPDLILTEDTGRIASTTNFMGRLSTFLAWHAVDPVSDTERLRNDWVFEDYQRNRNPFVDHPEWVDLVFRPVLTIACTNGAVEVSWELSFSNAVLEAANSPGAWTPQGMTPTNRAGRWTVNEAATKATRFYRLR